MTLNARFNLKCALRTARLTYTFVAGFGFGRTLRCSQREEGEWTGGLSPLRVGSWRAVSLR